MCIRDSARSSQTEAIHGCARQRVLLVQLAPLGRRTPLDGRRSLRPARRRLSLIHIYFKRTHGLERVVMANLASTEAYLEAAPVHASRAAFEAGLDRSDPAISPAMRYFYAAADLGIPYCNFTPSFTNIPALAEMCIRDRC